MGIYTMVGGIMALELRILENKEGYGHLQQREKTKWVDGSTTTDGYYDWSDWEDVPTIMEE